MFELPDDYLVPTDSYCIAGFYFCILYYNQPAYTAILQNLYSRSLGKIRFCFEKLLVDCKEWDVCVLFSWSLWKLKSYLYARLHCKEQQCAADTLGIDGVLIWLHRNMILTCLCSKWKIKSSWMWKLCPFLCSIQFRYHFETWLEFRGRMGGEASVWRSTSNFTPRDVHDEVLVAWFCRSSLAIGSVQQRNLAVQNWGRLWIQSRWTHWFVATRIAMVKVARDTAQKNLGRENGASNEHVGVILMLWNGSPNCRHTSH